MKHQLENTVTDTLNCLEENIFFIDVEYKIAWMNKAAEEFIESVKSFFKLDRAEDLIGTPIARFHKNPSYQEEMLQKGDFPIDMQLILFNKFVARLVVKELVIREQKLGFILIWKDITEREKEKEKTKALINELSTPILPTFAEHTLLVPLIGELTLERMENLTSKLLNECLNYQAEYVLLDFSGVTTVENLDLEREIQNLASAVELMGAEVIFCGFTTNMVKNLVHLGINANQRSFVSFRNAMRYVVSKLGYPYEK
ncbi:STAS domain-containing protein [Fictibacillus nanhaiensis]|uniref:STAS domain-containing protein n=1 Tax=Fictibacillus nanhaiensis TaxID=742169 RepID=UPI00203B46C6|nr:STAS domain-containing protein [Fictibacillus nanhaiensis]MCM3731384.1 STAS domain-containing protein [Fictibacillus nanhaiensis]